MYQDIFSSETFSNIFGGLTTQSFKLIIKDSDISLFRGFVTDFKKYLPKNSLANLSIVFDEEGKVVFMMNKFTALEMFQLGMYITQQGYKYEFVESTEEETTSPEGPIKR